MRKSSLPILFAIVVLFLLSGQAVYACSCAPGSPGLTREQYLDNLTSNPSAFVFSGKVTKISERKEYLEIKFRVQQYWGNDIPSEFIMRMPIPRTNCTVDFQRRTAYFVVATKIGDLFYTNICATSIIERAAKDLDYLGAGKIPVKK